MKQAKYILIDPRAETVTEGEFSYETDRNKVDQIQKIIGCRTFDHVVFDDETHDIAVDDEGLFPDDGVLKMFSLFNYSEGRLLAGRALIFSMKDSGEGFTWSDPEVSVDDIRQNVCFYDRHQAQKKMAQLESEYQ